MLASSSSSSYIFFLFFWFSFHFLLFSLATPNENLVRRPKPAMLLTVGSFEVLLEVNNLDKTAGSFKPWSAFRTMHDRQQFAIPIGSMKSPPPRLGGELPYKY